MTTLTANISIQTGTFVSFSPVLRASLFAVVGSFVAWYGASDEAYDARAIYSGVFDVLSIFTGFLATFYVFIATRGNEFLERIKKTATFSMVLKRLRFTILWAAGMIFFSYLLMIFGPLKYPLFGISHAVVFVWIANIALVGVNFARCVSQFSTIVSTE